MDLRPRHQPHWLAVVALSSLLALGGCGQKSAKTQLSDGQAALERKDFKAAVVNFKAALQADPKSAEVRFLLGRALLDAGDPVNALLELSKANDQQYEPDLVMPQLARALLLSGQGKKLTSMYGTAELKDKKAQASLKATLATAWGVQGDRNQTQAALDAALAAAPGYPPALVLQARILAGGGDFTGAVKLVNDALKADPNLYEGWHLLGEIQAHADKDTKSAEENFRKAITIEKAFVPGHVALIALRLQANDLPGAKKQLEELRAVLPQHPQTVFADAYISTVDKDFKRARDQVQLLLRAAPENTTVQQLAGLIEGQMGSSIQAESHFARALQLDPSLGNARRNLARVNLRMGKAARALEVIQPLVGTNSQDAEALGLAGEAALQLGDARMAETMFGQAASANPADMRARTSLAMTQLARGDAIRAFTQLEALAVEDKEAYADMALVSARMKRKETEAALTAADALVTKTPNSAFAHDLRGRVLTARKNYTAARLAFEKSAALDPAYFMAQSNLGALDMLEGKPDDAAKRMRDIITKDPRNHLARQALADFRAKAGAPKEEVRQILADAVTNSPSEPGARLLMIENALKLRDYKEALVLAQEAAAALPNDMDVLDALGRAQMAGGDQQQAISTFRKIASIDQKSARPHLRLADLLRAGGNNAAAITSLRRAIELEPGLEGARSRLVEVLLADNNIKGAIDNARDLQTRAPEAAVGYLLEATIRRRTKDADGAVAALRNGIQHAADRDEVARQLHRTFTEAGRVAEADKFGAEWLAANPADAGMQYEVAASAIRKRDFARAEPHLLAAVKLRPDHPMALNDLAWVLATLNKPGAVAAAQKAVGILPNHPILLDTLATAYASEKQFAQALETQKKAVDLAPAELSLRFNLAKIALQAGNKALARTELDKLSAMGAKLPFQSEVQQLMKSL